MRKIINTAVFLIVLSLFTFSCSKDWNEPDIPEWNQPDTPENNEPENPEIPEGHTENHYIVKDGEAFVFAFGSFSDIKVPSTVKIDGEEYPVTQIGTKACNENVKTLILPSSIKVMQPDAFLINNIENLYIEDLKAWCETDFQLTVDFVGHSVYSYLESVPIKSDTRFFVNGKRIDETLEIPSGVKEIKDYAFNQLTFENLILNDDLEKIGWGVFGGCHELRSIQFGDRLEEMGRGAFSSCNLQSLKLPISLKEIPGTAFAHNAQLKKVEFTTNI